jgi:hypothetical protein
MGLARQGLSRRGIGRAFARLWVILLVACGLYVGLAKAGAFHNPLFVMTEGDIEQARSEEPGVRILFLGNSFTFYNDMPHMLHELAAEDPGAPAVFAVARVRGSWALEGATDDKGFVSLVNEIDWDAVVLQERSWYLAESQDWWMQETFPSADDLRRKIAAGGDPGFLFETWGYRNGMANRDSYDWMQGRLEDGYERLGARLGMDVVPVGTAWSAVRKLRPRLDLWDGDGAHPNRAGSYLAACVFYARLTGRDPTRSRFTAGLDPADARLIQETAYAAVHRN